MNDRLPALRARRLALAVLTAAALVGAAGCDDALSRTQHELQLCRQDNAALADQAKAAARTIDAQQQQLDSLLKLGDKRLDLLFHVVGLQIGRYSSGIDKDGQAGDDEIRVYLHPEDASGDTIKAAGAVTIQLYDLANPPDKTLIGTYDYGVKDLGKSWFGGLLTYHYRFDCRWQSGPPAHPDITVRAAFTDYLTGKEFSAQKVITVKLPPASPGRSQAPPWQSPASQPATTAVRR